MADPTPPMGNAPQPRKTFDLSDPAQRKKFFLILGGAIVVVVVLFSVLYAATNRPDPTPTVTIQPTKAPTPTPVPAKQASNLDGVEVAYDLAIRHPLAIMIENLPAARPQTGLADANIVYEAITEGGITRFMGIFGHDLPEKAGPVRSARDVFVDFAEEYTPNSAYYAHVGGSPSALGKINGDKVYDLNQFAIGAKAFQRFPRAGLASEHTMYAFPDKLFQAAKDLGYSTQSTFRAWKFKKDADISVRPEAQTITIPFTSASYDVKYVYDKTTNTYKRYMSGSEHKDASSGKTIAPKNVIVEFVDYGNIPNDPKGRQNVKVIGKGSAKIFHDGKVTEAKWDKSSSPSRTIYTDAASGQEIEFNPGQLFVEIVKIGANVTAQ